MCKKIKHSQSLDMNKYLVMWYFLIRNTLHNNKIFYTSTVVIMALQCFDAVGWVAGRVSGRKKLSGGVLAWLSVWSEVQTCIWPS